MTLLSISKEAWLAAEAYFKANPTAIKMKRSLPGEHSFIKLEGPTGQPRIVALGGGKFASKGLLGEGTFAKVKIGQDKQGHQCAVIIEGGAYKRFKPAELSIMKRLNVFEGFALRFLDQYQLYKKMLVKEKLYTAMKKYEGQNLFTYLWEMKEGQPVKRVPFERLHRLRLAKKCAEALKKIHDLQIIHGDVKAANFIITECHSADPGVVIVDFGFSKQLLPGEILTWDDSCGTPLYMSPELIPASTTAGFRSKKVPFSFASDVYALGKLMNQDLDILPTLCRSMMAAHPSRRVSLESVIENLNQAIEYEVQANTKKAIADLPNPEADPTPFLEGQHQAIPNRPTLVPYLLQAQQPIVAPSLFRAPVPTLIAGAYLPARHRNRTQGEVVRMTNMFTVSHRDLSQAFAALQIQPRKQG